MKSPRDEYHHGDLRAALLEEARATVEAEGAEKFSLRAAARSLGVDIAAAYRHFRKKDDVLAAVAARGFDELGAEMAHNMGHAFLEGRPAPARFLACGAAYVRYGLAHPHLYRLMFGTKSTPEAIRRSRLTSPSNTAYSLLGSALNDLVDEGVLDSASRPGAELVAWAQVHGLVSLAIDGRAEWAASDEVTAVLERHLRAVLAGLVDGDRG